MDGRAATQGPHARPVLPRAVHDHPRRLDRERRAALDPSRSRVLPDRAAVDRQRLHAGLRGLPAPRRARGRPDRPAAGLRRGARALRDRSLLGGLAQSEATMIGARALQGLGGAVAAPATLSILTTTFTEGAERNRALGLWGAMGGVGGAAGALLGGVLTQTLSWRWIFLVNVPVALAIAVAALRVIVAATRDEDARRHFDLAGAVTVTAGLVGLTYGIVSSEQHGWSDPQTVGALAAGVLLLAAFFLVESRLAARPLVPLRIFS